MTGTTAQRIPLLELKGDALCRALGELKVTASTGEVALPLSRVDIKARVAERIAEVTVTEVFQNGYTEHLEAVYIFPVAGGAAVSAFEMQVKDRIIKGIVEERAEARRQYRQAVEEGRRAALLEKERDDVFTVQVGNLPPGEEVTIRLTYSERLPFFEDGTTEIRLPLVVAPRYIPGSPLERDQVGHGVEQDTDVVPDASRITPPRLAEGMDPKAGLAIKVELLPDGTAGGLADLTCSQHATRTSMQNGVVTVELSREDERLNKDFVLRWRIAGSSVATTFLLHRSQEGKAYGMVSIIPPKREGFLGMARDVVFILDRSGSMEGVKMGSAARACSLLLSTLEPRDRFAIQAFDDAVEWFEPSRQGRFINANEAGIEKGDKYLRTIEARGGTELDRAISDALQVIGRERKAEAMPVIVVLTDGQVGDEARILKRIQKEIGDVRVFTVGIDTAVNEGFLSRLASLGGGTSTFVAPGENLENALRAIGREIGAPLVVDVSINDIDSGIEKGSEAPARITDLFAGRSTTVYFAAKGHGRLKIKGRYTDGSPFEEECEARELELPAICHLWARTRIADLEDRFRIDPGAQASLKAQIIQISKEHTLLTRFTAFVVVDESEIVNKDGTYRTVVQPVEKPDRWDMPLGAVPASPAPCKAKSLMSPGALRVRSASPRPKPGASPRRYFEEEAEAMPCLSDDSFGAPCFEAPLMAALPAQAPCGMASSLSAQPSFELLQEDGAADMEYEPYCPEGGSPPEALEMMQDKLAFTEKREEAKPEADAEKKTDDAAKQKKVVTLASVVKALEKAIQDALDELKAHRLPKVEALEEARNNVMKVLAESDRSSDVPALQKFIRTAAVELIAALRTPGIAPDSLIPLFEKHLAAFRQAVQEVISVGGGGAKKGVKDEPFWESSI
ncbi:MAG: VIT domain-containing protein [Candidatus Xenobiia bacterium LiM19]